MTTMGRRGFVVWTVLIVIAVAVAAGVPLSRSASSSAAHAESLGRSSTPAPPPMRAGHRLLPRGRPFGLERPGTIVRSRDLFGDRVFANASVGFALVNGNNAQYPAVSADGGRHWRIDGPQVHVDAADGPEGVGFVGVMGPRTFFAFGSSVVDVTTDGGRVWWETLLGEQVMAVVPNNFHNELVAYVEQSVHDQHLSPAVTSQYVTRDGGRHWRYTTAFAGFSP